MWSAGLRIPLTQPQRCPAARALRRDVENGRSPAADRLRGCTADVSLRRALLALLARSGSCRSGSIGQASRSPHLTAPVAPSSLATSVATRVAGRRGCWEGHADEGGALSLDASCF